MPEDSGHWWQRANKSLTWWITILAGLAGIIALIVTLIDRPGPFTIRDWTARANSACDRNVLNGPITASQIKRDTESVLHDFQSNMSAQSDIIKLASDLGAINSAENKRAADLADIPRPNSQEDQVQRAISAFNNASKQIHKAMAALELIDVNNATSTQKGMTQFSASFRASIPYYEEARRILQKLGVTHCYT